MICFTVQKIKFPSTYHGPTSKLGIQNTSHVFEQPKEYVVYLLLGIKKGH